MAGGRGDPPKPIGGEGDEDWASALDEWTPQLDDAFNVEETAPRGLPPEDSNQILTEVSLTALPRELESAPLPLDEPPPLDAAAMDFGADLVTAQQEAIATLPGSDDPLRDLFDGELPPEENDSLEMEPIGEMLPTMRSAPTMSEHSQPTVVSIALPPNDDSAGEDMTRVFGTGELAPLLADERQALAYDDGEEEHLEISLEGALEAAAAVTVEIAPLPVDEDFYDAIHIEPGVDEPSVPRPAPQRPVETELDEEDEILSAPVRRDAGEFPRSDAGAGRRRRARFHLRAPRAGDRRRAAARADRSVFRCGRRVRASSRRPSRAHPPSPWCSTTMRVVDCSGCSTPSGCSPTTRTSRPWRSRPRA